MASASSIVTSPAAFNPVTAHIDSVRNDSIEKLTLSGNFQGAATGTEQITVVENDLLKASFSNKGGQLKSVELKNFKSYDTTKPVILSGGKDDADVMRGRSIRDKAPDDEVYDLSAGSLSRRVRHNDQHRIARIRNVLKQRRIYRLVEFLADPDIGQCHLLANLAKNIEPFVVFKRDR